MATVMTTEFTYLDIHQLPNDKNKHKIKGNNNNRLYTFTNTGKQEH